ncbi:MAG: murein biosynthesis integral membrane protein MurJ [Patescibacteria group bacterium]|nr:murein biosynthesis integral membrane protein MurJ [Patescibacteria group bacterium]
MIVQFLKNGKKLLTRRETGILSAAFFIMLTVFASRFLGLVRDRLLTGFFGAGSELGVFWAAVEIPDTIFYILGSAVFSSSFIPIFTDYLEEADDFGSSLICKNNSSNWSEAWEMGGAVLRLALLIFFVLGGVIFIFSKPISKLVAPGFDTTEISLMSGLVRVMTLAQFFFVLSYFLTSVLQSFQRFFLPALASFLYNLGVVLGTILLTPRLGIWGPAWGMVFGAVLHFAIQVPLAVKFGFSFGSFWGRLMHPGVKRVLRITIPRVIALLGDKLSLIVQVSLASLIPTLDSVSNVAVLTFARHLELVPIGLFGVSFSQATLPSLSRNRCAGKIKEFKEVFSSSFRKTFFLVAPAAIILLVLRIPAVRLAFGAKRFSWKATVLTGYTVAFFSLGIVFYSALHLLKRAFYALEEARTPVYTSLIFTAFGIFVAWLLTQVLDFGVWAIPLALSVSGALQAVLLFILLERRLGAFDREKLFVPVTKIGWATLFSGIVLYLPMRYLDKLIFDTTRVLGLVLLTGIAGFFGMVVYLVLTWVLDVKETKLFLEYLLSRLRRLGVRV